MTDAVARVIDWLDRGEKHYICVTGVHGVMECQKNDRLLSIHNASGLTVPDGMPMVWAGRISGCENIGRVYGPDLMLELCKASVQKGYTHFLYGGNIGVAEELKSGLEDRFPGIRIVGTYTPPFRPLSGQEQEELVRIVTHLQPDLFWVGLSTPKQEFFMAEYTHRLDAKVMLGVGAAFDIHTGRTKDAPAWIKNLGMQWLHRLCQEPRRLWRRYLYNNPVFVFRFVKQMIREGR